MLSVIPNKRIGLTAAVGLLIMVTLSFKGNSQSVDEQYLVGSACLMKADYDCAIESFTLAISRNNSFDRLFIKRGIAYMNTGQYQQAVSDFDEANQINPHVGDIWLARCYSLDNQPAKVFEFLTSHLNSPFKLAEDSIKKDPAFDRMQTLPEWFSFWQQNWYTDTEKVISDAGYYKKKYRYEQAIETLDKELLLNPGNSKLLIARGDAFQSQGNPVAAAADYSSALEKNKTNMEIYSRRADAYFKSGKFKEAVADYNKVLKMDPGELGLYIKRAQAYAAESAWDPALRDMQLYLKYFNDDQKAIFMVGDYYYQSGDYMNALKNFNRNMKEDPNNALYFKARGKTYLKTGTYRYAISDLSMSLDLNPTDADAWMYYGIALIKSGNTQDGCSSLHKAQNLGGTEALKYIVESCGN